MSTCDDTTSITIVLPPSTTYGVWGTTIGGGRREVEA